MELAELLAKATGKAFPRIQFWAASPGSVNPKGANHHQQNLVKVLPHLGQQSNIWTRPKRKEEIEDDEGAESKNPVLNLLFTQGLVCS